MLEPCTHPKTKETEIWNPKEDKWEPVTVCVICQVILEDDDDHK